MPEFIVKTYTPRAASGVRPQPRRTEDRSQRDRAKDTQTTMYHAGATTVWADALFVSVLQRSDQPGTGQVRQAIAAAVQAYGDQGCAQRVAQEFGDHPETAAARMHWAHAVASTIARLPAPARARQPPNRPDYRFTDPRT